MVFFLVMVFRRLRHLESLFDYVYDDGVKPILVRRSTLFSGSPDRVRGIA